MKRLFFLIACLHVCVLNATTFSPDRTQLFHDKYLTQSKQVAADAQLTVPPCASGELPIILVNNSGLPDEQVFILVLGNQVGTSTQFFLNIDTTSCPGKGIPHIVMTGDNGMDFTMPMSALPAADTLLAFGTPGRVFYLPAIAGGRIYVSMNSPLNIPIVAGKIAEPNFTSPNDPNYTINFDKFEFAYDNTKPGNPVLFVNSTAVDYFSIPLQGIVFNSVESNQSAASGLSQTRSAVLSSVAATFAAAPAATEWNKLFLKDPGDMSKTLRVVNPTKSIAQGTAEGQDPFDLNYFDNAAAYSGYSYIEDIWSGVSSFYKTGGNTLFIKIPPGTGTGQTYQADFSSLADKILFTSTTDASRKVILLAPTSSMVVPTTTSTIFAGNILFDPSDPVNAANPADAQQVSQLFEEAIIASVVPKNIPVGLPLTTGDAVNPNSPNNISSEAAHANFYMVNTNLSALGQTLGPWFSLYSKALHAEGLIYTYAFDEGMWPQVLIGAQAKSTTYVQITIGDVSP